MVFVRDMILNNPFILYWGSIRLRKKIYIYRNNQLENKNRKPHLYRIHDTVLVRKKKANKYKEPYLGPYPITQVWTNGNITIIWGAIKGRINIRWFKPYHK